jgi:hypothetical protein
MTAERERGERLLDTLTESARPETSAMHTRLKYVDPNRPRR